MNKQNHPLRTRLTALTLALLCVLGLFPITASAIGDTIKLTDFGMSGVAYQSDALGRCTLHQMMFSDGSGSVTGFCGTKGGSMGNSLRGQTWGNRSEITDPTVKTMMAYFYAHSTGVFTDEARAAGVDEVWTAGYTWYMNAWVQAIIWRYQEGSLNDPVKDCAEEYLAVYNSLEGTHYTSIDEELDGRSFRDRVQYILDLGSAWGDCKVYEYNFTGTGSSGHPASSVQKIVIGELSVPEETQDEYTLIVKKVDSTNPSKGLRGAGFHVQSENGSFSQDVITGADGTYKLEHLNPGTFAVTETIGPENYEIDNPGPQYVTLPNNGENTVTVTFTDTPTGGGEGSIRKVDADDPTKGLAGAVVKIEGVDNNFTGTYTSGEGGYFTDIPWDSMPIGSFTATEITPPSNYSLSPDASKVKQSFVWDGKTAVDLIFENDAKVTIELIKLDDSNNPLPGAVFNVMKDGQIIETKATDGEGKITVTEGITEGMFAFVEVSAPAPFAKLSEPVFAHVDQATINGGGTVTVTAADKRLPNLTILKRDSKTGDVISDTHFEIKGIHLGYHDDVSTGADGTATLTGIPEDSYEVTEISVPDPYVVSAEPTQTIWLEAGDNKQLIFDDQKQPLLKITKIEEGTGVKIPGTVFLLEAIDSDYKQNVTTEASGSVELRVEPGSYRVTEQSVPEPFVIGSERTKTISLNPGDEKEIVFENLPKPELTISKIDADTGVPVPGTVLEVKAINGDYQDDWTTGADGKVTKYVEPGTYQIKEKSVPAPYYLPDNDADRIQTISLNAGDVKTVLFRNHRAPELTIFKEDSVAGAPIEGAKFHVTYTSNGESAEAPASADYGYMYTDANGEIKLHEQGKRLYPGEFTITELAPAPGFQMKEPSTQKVIIHGGESKTVVFQNEPLNGLVVEKYDSVTHEALPGCTFQLRFLGGTSGTGGTVIGQKVTGPNGTAIWTGLTAGTYICEEIDAGDGYTIIQSSETVFIADNGTQEVITVRFENVPDGSLLIRKVCSVNPGTTLQDAEFKVTYSDGTLIGNSNGIYTTDVNGEILIDGLKPGKTVVVTETRAPAGFLIDTQSQTIKIKGGETVSLTFKNQPKGQLIIQKRNSVTGQPLPGAEFRVTTAAGCEVGLDGVIGTSTLTQNGIFTTDAQGEIRISNLAPGAYVLTELRAPSGFIMDSPSTNVVIGANGDTQTVVITNTPKGGLLIRKIDAVTGKALPGVKFKVAAANGEFVPDNEGMTSSNGLYTTDENGEIYLQKLNPNTYVVSEVEGLDGFLLDAAPQTVVVGGADTQVLTFRNTPLGGLLVKKMDASTKEPLADVIFKITRTDGTVVGTSNGEYRTDERSFISLPDLEPDSYIVQEVQAKSGYLLDDTPHVVAVKDHQTYTLEVFNQPLGNLIINKLSSADNTSLEGVKFEIKYADGRVVDNQNGQMSSNGLYTTDKNGQIIISGITGTVVVTELETISGYVIDANTRTQTVTVNPTDTQTLTFYNEPLCNLTLLKLDSVTRKPIADTEFTVREGNGGLIGRYVTEDNGTAVVNGLVPGSTVVVYESRVPEGYVLNAMPQTITVYNSGTSLTSGSSATISGNELTFVDDPKMTLTIHKYIEGTANKPLAGVAFKVVDDTGKPLNPDAGIFYTNNAGEIILGGLEPGMTITAQEVKTVDGYVLDGRPQSIKIEAGAAQNLTFWNKPAGSLIVRKLDKETGKPLAGVEFELMYAEGGYVDNENGHLSSNGLYYTDDHGEIHINGVTGTIVVKETRPLPGYTIEPGRESQTVTVNPQETQSLTFYNIPANTLTIQKYIDGSNNTPLAGVEFLVTDSSGAVVGPNNGYYTTDKDGRISISGLTPGTTIRVRETKTVDGYILDGTPQSVLIKAGEPQFLTFWNKKAGGLIVNKIDAVTQKPLAGVKFKITYADGRNVDQDGGKTSSNGIYVTDTTGQIKILGIVGTVIVEEIETVPGYYIDPNTKSQTVQINANDTQTVTFTNAPTQSLVIQKLEAGTKDQPLAGVEFLLTDSSGAAIGPNDGVYKTDAQGRITITGLTPGAVITARETKTLKGYVLDGTPQSREIKSGEVQTMTFFNEKAGTLVVQKKDKISGALIAGAQFQISYLNGEFVTSGDSSQSNKGIYTTDNAGEIRISGITGTVVVKEIQAASGYVIDQSTQTQTVKIEPMDTQTLVFLNEPLCSLTLRKIDSVTGKPVSGTEFTVKDTNGAVIGQYVTGDDGTVVVTGLIPGNTYVVHESRVPDGYVLNPTPQTITVSNGTGNAVTSGGTSTGSGTGTGTGNGLTFTDDPKMTLTIHKYIEGTANEPLAGVAFKITDGSGKPLNPDAGTYYTNNAGEIVLEGLEPGMTITAQEIKTVDGYVLDGNPQSIKIEAGAAQNLTFWNKPAGSLIVRKLDKETGKPLAGVEFELMYAEGGYVDNENGHLSSNGLYYTDDHGEIHINGVTGTIVVKETRPLPGYTIEPGREQQTVTVKPQETQSLTFYNIPSNTLTIQKYIDGSNNEPLAGVEFLVTDSSGAVVGPNNGYYTTDKDGRISIPGLTPGMTITVKETKTLDGYVLDGNPQSIVIKEGEAQSLTFWNKKAGTLVIEKKDSVSGALIPGAQFQLTYATGGFVDADNGHLSSNGIYTTDANGEIRISGIVGTVVCKEVQAAPGYVIDQSTQTQTVTIRPMDTQTLVFLNEPLCSLTLTKLDSVTGKPVPGTVFAVKDGNGNLLGTYTTGQDGTVTVTGLVPGTTVVVSEVKVPSGYVLDPTPRTIIVKNGSGNSVTSGIAGGDGSNGGNGTGTNGNGLTFENDPLTTLVIEKYITGTTTPLKGVTFLVTDSSGEAVGSSNGEFITDENGRIVIEGLEPGMSVSAKEIRTVEGYVLDTAPKTIKIKVGEAQTLRFYNEHAGTLVIRKLDKLTNKPLAGVEFELTYAEGGFVDDANGHLSSNGRYTTNDAGEIRISGVVGTIVVKEVKCLPGYTIDPATQTQTVTVNPADTQTLKFYNTPGTTLTIQKLVTGTKDEPLAGVEFLITDSSGAYVGPNNGIYRTDEYGRITLTDLVPGTVITAKETKTLDGYVLDGTPKSIEIKEGEAQMLTFYNAPIGGLELIKVSASDETKRISGVTFEIRQMDGALVDTVTTGDNGRVHVDLDAGDYYLVELKAADGFKIDATPHYFTIRDNETTTVTVTNATFSGDHHSQDQLRHGRRHL